MGLQGEDAAALVVGTLLIRHKGQAQLVGTRLDQPVKIFAAGLMQGQSLQLFFFCRAGIDVLNGGARRFGNALRALILRG